ncbi:hypothetical protein BST61_g448 [Cercospora zeina]
MSSHVHTVNPQSASHLMQLPQELRDSIYDHVFSTTRFCFGERAVGRIDIDTRRVVSAHRGKSLALLRTCKRTHSEIGTRWLSQTLFHFEDPGALLDKLASVSDDIRSQIRYLRVSGDSLKVTWGYDEVYWPTAQALKMLPGLNLDRLTILGHKHPRISYDTLDNLIKYSSGWRELYYLSHTSEMLGFLSPLSLPSKRRLPQPATWQQALNERDGAGSSVTIFRSNSPTRGSVLDPTKRNVLHQHLRPGQTAANYWMNEQKTLLGPGEREKELLVIVERGSGVKHAETNPASFLHSRDARLDSPAQTWAQVKELSREMRKWESSDDTSDDGSVDEDVLLLDKYDHVEDYTWPPFHFVI